MRQIVKYIIAKIHSLFHPRIYKQMDAAQPIFILACGHSGTSVLLAILDSHSQIQAIGNETQILQFEQNSSIIRWKFHQYTRAFSAPRWVEKTPRHIHHIAKIWRTFPTAKVILLVRDGRDVACSIKKRYADFEKGVQRWVNDNEAARPFWNHPNLYRLKLEDLQNAPEENLQALCRFLDLPFEQKMLTYHKQKRFFYAQKIRYSEGDNGETEHSQRRNWQINQPLQRSKARWTDEMNDTEKQIFKAQAQYLLEEFQYVRNQDW